MLQTLLAAVRSLAVFYCGLLPRDRLVPAELRTQLEASSFPPEMTLLISSHADDASSPSEF